MELWQSLGELLGILGTALTVGALFVRFRQCVTTGYILVGIILGPGGLQLINAELAEILAELGVVLLLFSIGLEFSWKRFKAFGAISLLGGLLQVGLSLLLTVVAVVGFGRSFGSALVWGGAIALSSTAVVLRTLLDRAQLDGASGRAAMAVLLFQDMAVVFLLLLVNSLDEGARLPIIALKLGLATLKGGALVGALFLLVRYLMPALFSRAAAGGNREHLVMFAVLTALGSAMAAHAIGLPPTLGAFLCGMMLGESYFAGQMKTDLMAFSSFFLTLFFVSIGMMADLRWAALHPGLVLGAVLCLVLFKALIATFVVYLFRHSMAVAVTAGVALANIGEFAFVLAKLALSRGVLAEDGFRLLVAAAIISMILTPYLMWLADRLVSRWRGGGQGAGEGGEEHGFRSLSGHTVVVGFGPVGKKATRALRAIGSEVVVVDLNPRLSSGGHFHGAHFLFGDASRDDILLDAGLKNARSLVLTTPDPSAIRLMIGRARSLVPGISILARARYSQSVKQLREAGADVVVDEEITTGEELARQVVMAAGLPAECVAGGSACQLPRRPDPVAGEEQL